jgi:anti-sigma28 factor (negative regulator of flagellin synthesis)
MNREQLLEEIVESQKQGLEIIRAKNMDYSTNDDPFKNFRMWGEIGFAVRMSDKVSRIQQLIQNGKAEVKDESLEDTLLDLANYSYLMLAYLKEKRDE